MPAGRPLKFKSVEALEEMIEGYFCDCDEKGRPYTVSGLAVFLDCDRQTLLNYEKKKEFFGTLSRAKTAIEAYAEECLFTARNTTGIQFNLKNNFGWKDKQEIKQTGQVNIHFDAIDQALCKDKN